MLYWQSHDQSSYKLHFICAICMKLHILNETHAFIMPYISTYCVTKSVSNNNGLKVTTFPFQKSHYWYQNVNNTAILSDSTKNHLYLV